MGRTKTIFNRQRIDVWLMENQINDLKKLHEKTGKTKTDIVAEALAIYFKKMAEMQVL